MCFQLCFLSLFLFLLQSCCTETIGNCMQLERQKSNLNIFSMLNHTTVLWYIISCGYGEKSWDFLQTKSTNQQGLIRRDAERQANKIGAFLTGDLQRLVCLLAIMQHPGIEKTKLEKGLGSNHLAESPARLRKCLWEGGGGSEGAGTPSQPLLLHSALHLNALVMHSSSPATSRVIQFPQQWEHVKFHLHLGLWVWRVVKTSQPLSRFVCLLLCLVRSLQ